MKNPRLVYRVILKLFTLVGVAILLYVLVASLFVSQEETASSVKKSNMIEFDLNKLDDGEIAMIRWGEKQIITLKLLNTNKYKVFFNTGDSGNCPLFYASSTFKDTCTGTLYDQNGQQKNSSSPKHLLSPPHYFDGNMLIIGRSESGK